MRDARPNAFADHDQGIWKPAETTKTSWSLLGDLATKALERKSKDLRIALWLTEATIRQYGFAGVRDSLRVIRELLTRYWDSGLYPLMTDGDLEMRSGPLEWLNDRLADVIYEIPLTRRNQPGDNYSYVYYQESRRAGGKITKEQFETAVDQTPLPVWETLAEDLEGASQEFLALDRICTEKFASVAPALSKSRDAIEEIRVLLNRVLREKRPVEQAAPKDSTPAATAVTAPARTLPGAGAGVSEGMGASWAQAEELARSGNVDQALAEMTKLAASEPNGRARFQRKFLLAEICLSTQRVRLAKAILEELNELIEKHQLAAWETADVVGPVWSRLYQCYQNEAAGTANPEQAAALFLKLCRLDPWQALSCNGAR
jgi:type VI secretion system protein ImpA